MGHRMKVAILCGGTRGDLQPYVALAEHLSRDHAVTLASHEPFRPIAESRGMDFVGLPGDPRQQIRTTAGREMVSSQSFSLRFVRQLSELVEPWLEELLEAVAPVCEGADVVVYSPLAFLAWHVAQATGTPTAMAALQPYAPTREFPTVVLGGRNYGRLGNLMTHHVADFLAWQSVRRTVNRLRVERLGLAPVNWRGVAPALRKTKEPHIFGFSAHFVPKPADWEAHHHVTGYWFLDHPESRLSPDLASFLDAGAPPIYVGFGSMVPANAARTAEMIIEAAREMNARLVMAAGWGGLTAGGSRDDVFFIDEAPHDLLFPRMRAVVHHGGAGTTAAGLRAGVPQLIVPFLADQSFWGSRVAAAAVGPEPIPQRHLSRDSLTAAFRDVTGNEVYHRSAARLGDLIVHEDGESEAAKIIETLVR